MTSDWICFFTVMLYLVSFFWSGVYLRSKCYHHTNSPIFVRTTAYTLSTSASLSSLLNLKLQKSPFVGINWKYQKDMGNRVESTGRFRHLNFRLVQFFFEFSLWASFFISHFFFHLTFCFCLIILSYLQLRAFASVSYYHLSEFLFHPFFPLIPSISLHLYTKYFGG